MKSVFVVAGSLLALSVAAQASQDQVTEELVVSATRTETPLAQTLAPVTVLSAADIAALQVQDLPDLVGRFTGVDSRQSGGAGAASSSFVRGTNTGHLLVLVDGVRIDSATLGEAGLQYLDPAAIERIELVRGPRSSLYGSDAIGGILQIFTRKADAEGLNLGFGAGLGSHNSQQYRTNLGWQGDGAQVNLVASHEQTDGFDRTTDTSAGNGDDDAYATNRLALSGDVQLSERLALAANLQYQQGETDTDNGFCAGSVPACEPYSKFDNGAANLSLKAQVTDGWVSLLALGYGQDESRQADHIAGVAEQMWGATNSFKTERNSLSWQNDFSLAEGQLLTLGLDQSRDEVASNNVVYAVDSRDNRGIFAQYQARVGDHSVVLSARNDDNDQFGNHGTGSLAYGYDLGQGWSLQASLGSAFKAPTFNDLYWPFSGNPELEPEESKSGELAAVYRADRLSFAWRAFRTEIDNLIAWAPDALGNWLPSNVNSALIKGSELELSRDFNDWRVSANYTYLEPEDRSTGKRLPNRADQLFNLDLSRSFGALSLGLSVEARSERYADTANSQRLAGYGLLNARAAWAFADGLSLELKLNNLLDKDYTVVDGYREDGLNGYAGVNYRF